MIGYVGLIFRSTTVATASRNTVEGAMTVLCMQSAFCCRFQICFQYGKMYTQDILTQIRQT